MHPRAACGQPLAACAYSPCARHAIPAIGQRRRYCVPGYRSYRPRSNVCPGLPMAPAGTGTPRACARPCSRRGRRTLTASLRSPAIPGSCSPACPRPPCAAWPASCRPSRFTVMAAIAEANADAIATIVCALTAAATAPAAAPHLPAPGWLRPPAAVPASATAPPSPARSRHRQCASWPPKRSRS